MPLPLAHGTIGRASRSRWRRGCRRGQAVLGRRTQAPIPLCRSTAAGRTGSAPGRTSRRRWRRPLRSLRAAALLCLVGLDVLEPVDDVMAYFDVRGPLLQPTPAFKCAGADTTAAG